MKIATPSSDEPARLEALKRYGILDTPSDDVIDGITQVAADLCETPIALISLIDPNRQWFKSCTGLSSKETSRDIAFCAHAIKSPDALMEVEDASLDERFRDNPLVTGEPNIRFYAGKPLVTPDGFALGTLCVIDNKPRTLTTTQRNGLIRLSKVLTDLFNERYHSRLSAIDYVVQQSIMHGLLITDPAQPDNPITYVNKALERMTGYSSEDILGKNCRVLQGENTDPESVKLIREAIAESKPVTVTMKNYRKDGSEFWNEFTLSPVQDSAGKTVNFVGVQQDVSHRFQGNDDVGHSS